MSHATLTQPETNQGQGKLRVCVYYRTATKLQLTPIDMQIKHHTDMIHQHKEWELVDIFVDDGIPGRSAENRSEFQRMIRRCERHHIDLVITKSMSCFSRNTIDCLGCIQKLKQLGVGIQFEKEGINTLNIRDEILLNMFPHIMGVADIEELNACHK